MPTYLIQYMNSIKHFKRIEIQNITTDKLQRTHTNICIESEIMREIGSVREMSICSCTTTYLHIYSHIYTHIPIHTHTHTHTHTHIYIYIYIYMRKGRLRNSFAHFDIKSASAKMNLFFRKIKVSVKFHFY